MTLVADVWIDKPDHWLRAKNNICTYSIPEALKYKLQKGSLVLVPFGKNTIPGLIINIYISNNDFSFPLKPIDNIILSRFLSSSLLSLITWGAKFYCTDLWTTFRGALPLSLFSKIEDKITLKTTDIPHKLSPNQEKVTSLLLNSANNSLSLNFIKQKLQISNLSSVIKTLIDKDIIHREKKLKISSKTSHKPPQTSNHLETSIQLNPSQKSILSNIIHQIHTTKNHEYLIHGVTGSGKTELYCALIKQYLDKEQQILYLIPEIALSIQLWQRIQRSLPQYEVLLWHSTLTDNERIHSWQMANSDKPIVILGTRSAVFAPLNNLGLIIIDEEHDSSFKNNYAPFYDARVVARKRARIENCPIIFGSATPSIELYHHTHNNNTLHSLKHRHNQAPLPTAQIVDMREELLVGNRSILSRQLKKALDTTVENNEQAIIFLNRRGFAKYVFCRDCGHTYYCPHCSVSLIYHKLSNKLTCHHCHYTEAHPSTCSECNSSRVKYSLLGTEKIEDTLSKMYINAEIIRLDRDTITSQTALKKIWDRLLNHSKKHPQIIIGTQLIAKGIDLPNITLVGVLQAESSLHFPEYTASEKTFQLLTQISGRTGRHHLPGKVIFQTYTPDDPYIELAAQTNYQEFYNKEIQERQNHNYPPFSFLVRLLGSHTNNNHLETDMYHLLEFLQNKNLPNTAILGPAPCPLDKVNDNYRWQILIKTQSLTLFQKQSKQINAYIQSLRSKISIDVQSLNLL